MQEVLFIIFGSVILLILILLVVWLIRKGKYALLKALADVAFEKGNLLWKTYEQSKDNTEFYYKVKELALSGAFDDVLEQMIMILREIWKLNKDNPDEMEIVNNLISFFRERQK